MRSYLHALTQLAEILASAWRDPRVHVLMVLGIGMLLTGTVVYHVLEGWSWLDSLYFSAVTLATVGYGDLHPVTDLGKLFTVFYIFIGVGVFVGIFALIARAGAGLDATGAPPSARDLPRDLPPKP